MEFHSRLGEFFRAFERNADQGDVSASVGQFSEAFIAGGPAGASVVRSEQFAAALPRRQELFSRLGCRATRLISLEEIEVDARYVLAKTGWSMVFGDELEGQEGGEKEIRVESAFVVDTGVEPFRILLYLAGNDIFALMRERGIMPAEGAAS